MDKIPKRLKVDRGCFYALPDDSSNRQLHETELHFRAKYKGVFFSRVGLRFYFEFASTKRRDDFLLILEASMSMEGFIYERQTIYK